MIIIPRLYFLRASFNSFNFSSPNPFIDNTRVGGNNRINEMNMGNNSWRSQCNIEDNCTSEPIGNSSPLF